MFDSSGGLLLALAFFVIAVFYASVGHAGASGYLAVMALAGFAPETMRPLALLLNVLVAGFVTWRMARAGFLEWRRALPFVLLSAPFAYLGGRWDLPAEVYRPFVGGFLIYAAGYLWWRNRHGHFRRDFWAVPRWLPLPVGAALGLVAGLTGIGGGILLSPLLMIGGWTGARHTAALASFFILVNSAAGLIALAPRLDALPAATPFFALAVIGGGAIGAELATRRLTPPGVVWVLVAALMLAGLKFLLL